MDMPVLFCELWRRALMVNVIPGALLRATPTMEGQIRKRCA